MLKMKTGWETALHKKAGAILFKTGFPSRKSNCFKFFRHPDSLQEP